MDAIQEECLKKISNFNAQELFPCLRLGTKQVCSTTFPNNPGFGQQLLELRYTSGGSGGGPGSDDGPCLRCGTFRVILNAVKDSDGEHGELNFSLGSFEWKNFAN
eukprot:s709_g37.t1